jgi:hypothetical protein
LALNPARTSTVFLVSGKVSHEALNGLAISIVVVSAASAVSLIYMAAGVLVVYLAFPLGIGFLTGWMMLGGSSLMFNHEDRFRGVKNSLSVLGFVRPSDPDGAPHCHGDQVISTRRFHGGLAGVSGHRPHGAFEPRLVGTCPCEDLSRSSLDRPTASDRPAHKSLGTR